MSPIEVLYYTDPVCPWSWALEPALRTLRDRFGEQLRISYVMCGLMRERPDPVAQVSEQLEAADRSGMPVDPRLWLEDPPASSHPACVAVKAAAEQGEPGGYLRALREGFMCRRRRLDRPEALIEEARRHGGLDIERFRIDLGSHATLEAFAADLDRAAAVAAEHHAPGTGRVALPSLEFRGEDGETHGVYGFADYERLRSAALAAGAAESGAAVPAVEEALRRHGPLATAEVAALCALPGPRAPAELWRLATEWRVRSERVGLGELWALA